MNCREERVRGPLCRLRFAPKRRTTRWLFSLNSSFTADKLLLLKEQTHWAYLTPVKMSSLVSAERTQRGQKQPVLLPTCQSTVDTCKIDQTRLDACERAHTLPPFSARTAPLLRPRPCRPPRACSASSPRSSLLLSRLPCQEFTF